MKTSLFRTERENKVLLIFLKYQKHQVNQSNFSKSIHSGNLIITYLKLAYHTTLSHHFILYKFHRILIIYINHLRINMKKH